MTGAPPDLTEQEVLTELERVLATPEFRKNPTARQFLGFIVRETLAGRGDRLKAFTIATLALQRDANFDPQQNSIVRVHATRLRQLLEACNAAGEPNQTVRILLPRGSYQPAFERAAQSASADSTPQGSRPPLHLASGAPSQLALWGRIAAHPLRWPVLCAVAAAALITILFASMDGSPTALQKGSGTATLQNIQRKPRLLVVGQEPTGPTTAALRTLVNSVENAISNFDHVMVTTPEHDGADVDYKLTISPLGPHGEHTTQTTFRLQRGRTGEILWTRQFDRAPPSETAALADMTRTVVLQVADTNGALVRDIERRVSLGELPNPALRCEVKAMSFLYKRDAPSYSAARECLDRSLKIEPDDAALLSLKAIALVRGYLDALPGSNGVADLQAGLQNARAAYDRLPYRARTRYALFLARFYDHRYDDAFNAARQALAANPYSTLISSSIGSAYITRGRYAEGIALLDPPHDPEVQVHGPYASYLALAALMTGDMDTQWKWASRTSTINSPFGVLMRAIGCRYRGDQNCVDAMTADLQQRFPGFAADVPASSQRYAFTDEIRNRLLKELGSSASAQSRPN